MLIIVEGFDNSGKTTLCNFLEEKLSHFTKVTRYKNDNLTDHKHRLTEILASTHLHPVVLCDRISIIGEEVYGKVLRGKSCWNLTLEEIWTSFMNSIPSSIPVVFIYCLPSNPELGNKPEMEGVIEHQEALRKAYHQAALTTEKVFYNASHVKISNNRYFRTYDYQKDGNFLLIEAFIDYIISYHGLLDSWKERG